MPRTLHRGLTVLAVAALAFALIATTTRAEAVVTADTDDGRQTWALTTATADGPDGRGVFEYIVEPDDVYEDFLAVRNFGEQPITVSVHAQDATQTSSNDFEVLTLEDESRGVGAWTRIATTEVTVPARASVVIPFTINVPADAEPGDHAGAILAVSTPADDEGATVQLRTGTRIYLRVAGPVETGVAVNQLSARYESSWSPFSGSSLDLTATLENTGNVRVSPQAEVSVSSVFGWWSQIAALEGFTEILPKGAQSGGASLDEVPPLGPLWVTVRTTSVLSSGQDLTSFTTLSSQTVVVWAVPWALLGAFGMLLIAVAIAIVGIRRRHARARASRTSR